jgi:hypothetical protein
MDIAIGLGEAATHHITVFFGFSRKPVSCLEDHISILFPAVYV